MQTLEEELTRYITVVLLEDEIEVDADTPLIMPDLIDQAHAGKLIMHILDTYGVTIDDTTLSEWTVRSLSALIRERSSAMFSRPDAVLTDQAKPHRGDGADWVATPRTAERALAAVRAAKARGLSVRVRGNGHSLIGSSVPRREELLLRSTGLNYYEFGHEGTVTLGGGATVWHANSMLVEAGFQLPVHNDAGPASTVGAYICAGGVGAFGAEQIGFWEAVTEVTIATGEGVLRKIARTEPDFRWLFGSMGQLGLIVEATVRILPLGDSVTPYPLGRSGRIEGPSWQGARTLWYEAVVPADRAEEAKATVQQVWLKYSHLWTQAASTFAIPIEFRTFTPPLISPYQGDLVVVGTFGDTPGVDFDWTAFRALSGEIAGWVASDPALRRYAPAEMLFDDFDYTAHYGTPALREFATLKRRFDPDWLFCAGPLADALRAESAGEHPAG